MSDENAAATMAKRTRLWASQFTWDEMADQTLSMLRAEGGRLAHVPNNRRTITDLATVVRVPVDLLPNGEVPGFRCTDKRVVSPGELVVLLRNTDMETARVALRRAGFSPSAIDGGRVQFAVARPIDLVSPAIGTTPATTHTDEQPRDALAG